MRKAELAFDKEQTTSARAALERFQSFTKMADGYTQQVADQKQQVDTLRRALEQLEQKLVEARQKSDILIAQHRRAPRARARQRRAARDDGQPAPRPASIAWNAR
jgi:phage shock protein A